MANIITNPHKSSQCFGKAVEEASQSTYLDEILEKVFFLPVKIK